MKVFSSSVTANMANAVLQYKEAIKEYPDYFEAHASFRTSLP